MNTPKELGKRIRELREAQGMSQDELAKRLGLARATVGYYEKGRNNFTIETYEKVLTALGYELILETKPKNAV